MINTFNSLVASITETATNQHNSYYRLTLDGLESIANKAFNALNEDEKQSVCKSLSLEVFSTISGAYRFADDRFLRNHTLAKLSGVTPNREN
jgi:hypothetical protein